MFRYGYGVHHGPGVFGWVVLALIVAALVVGIVALVRLARHGGTSAPVGSWAPHGPPADPALAELRLRYARGDISSEEYAQRAANLGFPTPSGPGPGVDASPPQAPPAS